jgi:hypothetical protein
MLHSTSAWYSVIALCGVEPCYNVHMLFNTRNVHVLNVRNFLVGMA